MRFFPSKIKFTIPKTQIAEDTIFIPRTLDSLNIPIKNGLHDTALGPQPHETYCMTCKSDYYSCPGHFGEVRLSAAVFNPLLFRSMFYLLKCTCLACHRFRVTEDERRVLAQQQEEGLFGAMKEYARDRCPRCGRGHALKRLNMKIVGGGRYLRPGIVRGHLERVQAREKALLGRMRIDCRKFFMDRIYVLPNKFRPLNRTEGLIFESAHNIHLSRIIKANNLLRDEIENMRMKREDNKRAKRSVSMGSMGA